MVNLQYGGVLCRQYAELHQLCECEDHLCTLGQTLLSRCTPFQYPDVFPSEQDTELLKLYYYESFLYNQDISLHSE